MHTIIENIKSNIKMVPTAKSVQLDQVEMDLIRYANCWEDADLLLEGLGNQRGKKILSIASGGDNSLSLLTLHPEKVVAVDLNKTQLYVTELKREAIRNLTYDAFLAFVGFRDSASRMDDYNKLRLGLSRSAKLFWDSNFAIIENGLVYGGKFEKYLLRFCKTVLPLIHSKSTVKKLLAPKSEKEQQQFVAKHWNSFRWRMMFKIFFSRFCLGYFGRDPQFLKEVKVNVGKYLLEKANSYLSTKACQSNWMLQYILLGNFNAALPFYAQAENFAVIKRNLDSLYLYEGLVEDAISKYNKFDAFNLSNIFEYMDTTTFQKVGENLIHGSNTGARLAYWNLMVPRNLSQEFKSIKKNGNIHPQNDKGFFYRSFNVDTYFKTALV